MLVNIKQQQLKKLALYTNKDGKVMLAVYADLKKANKNQSYALSLINLKQIAKLQNNLRLKQLHLKHVLLKIQKLQQQDVVHNAVQVKKIYGSISAARVKAKQNIEAGKKATGSPVTPTQTKQLRWVIHLFVKVVT